MLKFFQVLTIISASFIGCAFAFLPKSFEAQIEQEQKSSLSQTVRKSQGQMFYRYPAQMRLEIKGSDEVIFVTNGKRTWYYTGPFVEEEPGELTISDDGPNVMTKFFDSFSQGLVSNELYKVEKTPKKANVVFSEQMVKDLGIKSAEFLFKDESYQFSKLDRINLLQEDGREIGISLKKLETDKTIDPSTFTFVAPANTKIKN